MAIVTATDTLQAPADRRRRRLEAVLRRPDAWYAGFAVYAACVAAFSGPGPDRWWGIWAAGGYGLAAVIAASRRGRAGQVTALAVAVAGALVAALTWLATQQPSTQDATVVARSGVLLLHHGSPYLPMAQLAHGGWLADNPSLPAMAVFGLPKALGLPGILGDPRPWLAVVTFLLLYATFLITAKRRAAQLRAGGGQGAAVTLAALAIASPVLAFPLAMGSTNPPVIALICLTLAMLTRGRHGARRLCQAAMVLGVVCAMKDTAWPVLAVLVVMVGARDGGRPAARFCAVAVGTAAALTAALAPAALSNPDALWQNTIAYPLGLAGVTSPAASPLPGHLLATLGQAGHATAIALLAVAVAAVVLAVTRHRSAGDAPVVTIARVRAGR